MTTIESPMEDLTPAYNRHYHNLILEDDALPATALTEGKVYFKFPDLIADYDTFNPNVFDIFYHRNLPNELLIGFRISNRLYEDVVYYEGTIQPNGVNNLLVLQNYASAYNPTSQGTTDTTFLAQNYLDILACYNQWAYTFNNTFTSQYFEFSVFFDIEEFNNQITANTITLGAMKDIMYVKYVPRKGAYYNFAIASNQNILVTEGVGVSNNPNKVLLLKQPHHKIEIYKQNSNDITQLFPLDDTFTSFASQTLIQNYTTPIDKNLEGEYVSYLNLNKVLQRYVKTLTPKVGSVTAQTEYLLPYNFKVTEVGNVIKNGYFGVGTSFVSTTTPTLADVVNYDRSLISLELDSTTSEVKWVCNAAKDKLSIYTMRDYYKNEQTIVPLALTNQPDYKDSYFCNDSFNNSREFLSFIYKSTALPTSFRVNVVVTNADGTTVTINKIIPAPTTLTSVYTVDVSPDVIGLRELNLQDFVSWTVRIQVEDATSPLGFVDVIKPKTYNRIVNGLPNRFNVLFINQLGMWDTFTFTGDNDFNYSQKYQTYRKSQGISTTPNDLVSGNYNSTVVKGYQLKSNQLDKKHIEWLQELLDSPEIKIFNNNKLESYYITKSDVKMDSVKNLFTLNLDVVRTIENNSINN